MIQRSFQSRNFLPREIKEDLDANRCPNSLCDSGFLRNEILWKFYRQYFSNWYCGCHGWQANAMNLVRCLTIRDHSYLPFTCIGYIRMCGPITSQKRDLFYRWVKLSSLNQDVEVLKNHPLLLSLGKIGRSNAQIGKIV